MIPSGLSGPLPDSQCDVRAFGTARLGSPACLAVRRCVGDSGVRFAPVVLQPRRRRVDERPHDCGAPVPAVNFRTSCPFNE